MYLSPNQTTATNGTSITLGDAALAGDIIDVIIASPVFQGATTTTDQLSEGTTNLYFTNARARAAISETVTGLDYNSSTGVLSITTGYGIPTTASQTTWDAAYNDKINSAAVTGSTTKTLTLTQQDGGTVTATWTDINTDAVTSVFGRTGVVVAVSGDYTTTLVTEGTNLYYTDARARAAISVTGSGSYNSSTGVITVTGGVTSVNTLTGAVVLTTTNIAEGTNLYYTDARVGTYLTTNSYATQTYVGTQIANLVASAPATLDTLNELAAALGNDPSFATTVATSIGTKVPQTRTITINGTALDLSADRSFTIAAGVTSFNTRTGAITPASGDYTTALVTESGNLYYTDARVRLALSFVAGSGGYNSTTGVITIPTNNTQITNGANYITLVSLSSSATGLTYTYWKDANATQALANPDKVSVSGTYYIVGKSSTGCTSAPTAVKVTVNPLPVATIIAPTQTAICDKSSITLTARGGTSYQWLLNGSAIAGAIDSTYAASQAGSYEVNVIALGCTSKVAAPVNLTLIKAAVPKFSNSSTCIDVPVSFFNEIKKISLQVNKVFLLLFLLKPCWICSNLEVVKLSFPSKIKVIVFDTA